MLTSKSAESKEQDEFVAQQNTDNWRFTDWIQTGAQTWQKQAAKFWRVPHAIKLERMSICSTCPEYIKTTTQCRRCGCFMGVKTWLGGFSCPLDKWSAEQTPDEQHD